MFALQSHEFSGQLADPQEEWGAPLVPGAEEDIRSQSFSVFNVTITKIVSGSTSKKYSVQLSPASMY
jgi:hypothetical protein